MLRLLLSLSLVVVGLVAGCTDPVDACPLGVSACQQQFVQPVYSQQFIQPVQQVYSQPVFQPVQQQYVQPVQSQVYYQQQVQPVIQKQLVLRQQHAHVAPVVAVQRQPILGQRRQNRAARIVAKGQVRGNASLQVVQPVVAY